MPGKRLDRVNQLMKEEISLLLQRELKDPGLGFVSVTEVAVAKDLRSARVYVSVLGTEAEWKASLQALDRARGFIRNWLAPRLRLRTIPHLTFHPDRSMAHAAHIRLVVVCDISDLVRDAGVFFTETRTLPYRGASVKRRRPRVEGQSPAQSDPLPGRGLRVEARPEGDAVLPTLGRRKIYNSLIVLGHGGGLAALYDKIHLVPFGEYLPFQDFMESMGIFQMTGVRGGFSAGSGSRLLSIPGAPQARPLICYEIIFPDEILNSGPRPGWLLNVTNDAWFGRSSGPYQHLAMARLRAIEEGLPLIRAANTGISAVVDPFGRVRDRLPLGVAGVIDAGLPGRLAEAPPVRRWGGWITAGLL